jgi:hypothetical protein
MDLQIQEVILAVAAATWLLLCVPHTMLPHHIERCALCNNPVSQNYFIGHFGLKFHREIMWWSLQA